MKKIIKNFPIPPSINKQLTSVRGRLIKTSTARLFDAHVQRFKLVQFRQLAEIAQCLDSKKAYRVDCYFIFHKDRLIGKKNQIKALDVNNYLKSSLDGLVKCLEVIDDKNFIAHHVEKLSCENPKDEQVVFVISEFSLKSFDQLIEAIASCP